MIDSYIAGILVLDGLTTGMIYALLGLSIVLVFSVTRVLFIPQGEFVSFGALTLAALQAKMFPAIAYLLMVLGCVCFIVEVIRVLRMRMRLSPARWGYIVARDLLLPLAVMLLVRYCVGLDLNSLLLNCLLTLLLVVPLGPFVYRLAFEPVAQASTLTLMIIAISAHFALMGLGLVMFGPEGVQVPQFAEGGMTVNEMAQWVTGATGEANVPWVGELFIQWQGLIVIATTLVLALALYVYFGHTFMGKALQAMSVNRLGARLVGINTERAGRMTFTIAAALGAISGILIASITTIYYDSGFLMSLKGFIGAVFGGMTSYPLSALGSVMVGLLESGASYFASAYKEVIVFTLIIPLLLWLSLSGRWQHQDEEGEEA